MAAAPKGGGYFSKILSIGSLSSTQRFPPIHHASLSTSSGVFRTSHASCCFFNCVSLTRDSSPFLTQPPQRAMTSETTLDYLGFSPPPLMTPLRFHFHVSDVYPELRVKIANIPSESSSSGGKRLAFQVYLALRGLLEQIVFLHALARQDDGMLVTVQ